jgi:hypothetical protein
MLPLARAELETAHADAPLSPDELADLAEARWRMGDLAVAGDAAAAALAAGSRAATAWVIAVEADRVSGALVALGAGERAVLEAATLDEFEGLTREELDRIFAGMPRGNRWAPDAAAERGAALARGDEGAVDRGSPGAGLVEGRQRTRTSDQLPFRESGATSLAGLVSDPAVELAAASQELAADGDAAAAARLSLLLRAVPSAAAAVAELLETPTSPVLAVVRGDALRLAGRLDEADRAWADAATGLSRSSAGPSEPGASDEPVKPAEPAAKPSARHWQSKTPGGANASTSKAADSSQASAHVPPPAQPEPAIQPEPATQEEPS